MTEQAPPDATIIFARCDACRNKLHSCPACVAKCNAALQQAFNVGSYEQDPAQALQMNFVSTKEMQEHNNRLAVHMQKLQDGMRADGLRPYDNINVCRLLLLYTAAVYESSAKGYPSKRATQRMLAMVTSILQANGDI